MNSNEFSALSRELGAVGVISPSGGVTDFGEWCRRIDERVQELVLERREQEERWCRRLQDLVRFRSVGRIFELGDRGTVVVRDAGQATRRRDLCERCIFSRFDRRGMPRPRATECTPQTAYYPCSANRRIDGRSVIFEWPGVARQAAFLKRVGR